jgi:hypothetical protein
MIDANKKNQKPSVKSGDNFRKIKEDPYFKSYLDETLLVEDLRKKKKQYKITNVEDRKIKNNDDRKVRVLDNYIFGSMANLIYLFRFMQRHPELIDRFGEDIEELLGLKEDTRTDAKRSFGFEALFNLILNYHSQLDESLNDNRFNFKRHLLPILQDSIYHHVTTIFRHRQEDMIFRNMVDDDFQRAKTWTEHADREPKHAHKEIRRKIILSEELKRR